MLHRKQHLNITAKFIVYFVAVSIVPLIAVGCGGYFLARNLVEEEAANYTQELVRNHAEYVDLQLIQIEGLLANIASVEEITNALENAESEMSTFDYLATQARIGYTLNSYLNLQGLVSIDIFNQQGVHFHVGDTLDVTEINSEVQASIIEAVGADNQPVTWLGLEDNINVNSSYQKVITAVRPISYINQQTFEEEILAYILVNYDPGSLYHRIGVLDTEIHGDFIIVDGQNQLIHHPNHDLIGSTVNSVLIESFQERSGMVIENIDDQDMVISYAYSERSDWIIMNMIPRRSFTQKTASIGFTTFGIVLITLLLGGVVSWIYNRDIVAPIREITSAFQNAQTNTTLDRPPLVRESNDEIGELVQWFNLFMDNLQAKANEEEALRHMQKLESLGVLAGGIAHDFNNLLVGMLAQTSLAIRKLPAEHAAISHIRKAEKAAERAAELTQQMLAYSGRGHFEIQSLNINSLISENMFLLQAALPKQVTLQTQLLPTLPTISGDRGQIQQVIMNLILNGAEAVGGNVGFVQVRTDLVHLTEALIARQQYTPINSGLQAGTYVMFQVQDDGCGMDEGTVHKIFDPFFTTKFTGRGLGLAAVLGIIQGHHGSIFVESVEGEGTTITVYFPMGEGTPQTNEVDGAQLEETQLSYQNKSE